MDREAGGEELLHRERRLSRHVGRLQPRGVAAALVRVGFMKVYISADIEGTSGITNWEQDDKTHPTYQEFRERMTDEVVAACEGAIEAGAKEIVIKDAHGSGRNIIAARLPDCAKLIRGWSGHPFCMVQELDQSFDALLFVGYHAKAGSD